MSHALPFDWSAFLGPFHVVMLHFPIGFFGLAVLLELWASRRPSDGARQAVGFALGMSVAVAWLVALLGYLRASRGEYDERVVYWHTVLGLAFGVLSTVTWFTYVRWRPQPDRRGLQIVYRGLLGVSAICLVAAAHGGGTLTHGSKFLTEGAPTALRNFVESVEANPDPTSSAPTDFFHEQIEPILSRKCYPCHGAEKQKGKLRLDLRATAIQGGESGTPAIVPGEPLKSHLVAVMLLPPEHDDVMPPAGKEVLKAEEVLTLIRWIQSGASYGADGL